MTDSNNDSTAIWIPNGGHKASPTWPTLEEILSIHHDEQEQPAIFFLKWDIVFAISCTVAVFLDPLYRYIPVVIEDRTCFHGEPRMVWTFFGLRSAVDLFYAMDIAIFWRRWNYNNAKAFEARIHKLLPRMFVALPLPQVILLTDNSSNPGVFYFLSTLTPLQYVLRIYRIYVLLKQFPGTRTEIGRQLKAMLDFIPFILVAHKVLQLYGALWYELSVIRETRCWVDACQDKTVGCDLSGTNYLFSCGTDTDYYNAHLNITHIKASCTINPPDTIRTPDFGIYMEALQFNMTSSTDLSLKMLQCFWWGLRNLSSFGSNLQTSPSVQEIMFTVLVSISGMGLFLVYLNTRVQMLRQTHYQLKLRRKVQMMNPDIDLLLYKKGLNKSLKKVIMNNLQHKLEENKDVDVENILSLVPTIHKRHLVRVLGSTFLKKVSMLENMDERVLEVICDHLKLVKYSEDNYIVQEGEPLEKMLFITQGTAWSYTSSASGTSAIKCLVKGDFYGEELLNWASRLTSFSAFPNSTKIVKAHTNVEALVIKADNLNSVVSRFWWHFSNRLGHMNESQLERCQHLAASSIQAKWRYHLAKAV